MRLIRKFLALIFVLLALESAMVVHEYGHLTEFKKRGVSVKEFSIGIGPPIYQYRGFEFLVSFRMIPIVAYVAPTVQGTWFFENKLSFWDKFVIDSAGVRNNIVVALVFLFSFQILGWRRGNLSLEELIKNIFFSLINVVFQFFALMLAFFTLGRKQFGQRFCFSTGGIVPPKWLRPLILINLMLGLGNFVPIPPLDGGEIAQEVLTLFGAGKIPGFIATALLMAFIVVVNRLDWTLLEVDLKEKVDDH